jgi:hypothetical protein
MARRLLALSLVVVAAVAGCGGLDRDEYVDKNLALLKQVPAFPGARLVRVESAPYEDGDTSDADTIGYGTTRLYKLPDRTSPNDVITFYRQTLRGWRVVDLSMAPSLSLRKGDAYLHVLPSGEQLIVEIDHDCYKGGPSPRCFGP